LSRGFKFIGRAVFLLVAGTLTLLAEEASDAWAYLDNGSVRLGVKKSSGAAIGYFSTSQSRRNLLNHYDHGRLVQQSYYGNSDDSMWAKTPWRWNPVQGGDYKGHASTLLELRTEKETLYAKTRPRHWATGEDLAEVTMEEWIKLTGKVAHVRFKMSYTGTNHHSVRDQEIPAFFAEPELVTLVLYDGKEPWTGGALSRSGPGWPNESRRMTENWAAYVGTNDFGIGAYVPVATNLTCYRYGKRITDRDACSYFAPLTRFAVTPGLVFEYDLYLTIGTSAEIRETFRKIRKPGEPKSATIK